jgi:hypothetical protein
LMFMTDRLLPVCRVIELTLSNESPIRAFPREFLFLLQLTRRALLKSARQAVALRAEPPVAAAADVSVQH